MASEDPGRGPSSQSSQSSQPASQGHAFLTMSSFQSMVGSFTQEALYSQLAQLGIPSGNLVRSSLSNESVSSSFQLGSYPQVVSTWPGMSSAGMCNLLYSSRTPAPAFLQPNLATANSFDSRPGGGTFGNPVWEASSQRSPTLLSSVTQAPFMSLQPGFNTVWPSLLGMNSQMNAVNHEPSFKPISVGSSVAPVPSELVGAIANNEYIDFKLLLPSNLAWLSVMPSLSTQSIARLITSKLSPVSCFRDWASAWAVYASVVSKVAPGNLPDLISYMLVITEAAKRSDFDWEKYDRLFCQGAALDNNKCWGVADPSIWVHCLGKHQPVPVSVSPSNPNSGPKFSKFQFCYAYNYSQCHYGINCRFRCHYGINCRFRCHYGINCRFLHRCMICNRGFHLARLCPRHSNSRESSWFPGTADEDKHSPPSPPPKKGKSR